MRLLADAMSGLGAALLPVAAALLFEELTFGGLVRLLLAPWPGARKHGARGGRFVVRRADGKSTSTRTTPQTKSPFVGSPGSLEAGNDRAEDNADDCGSVVDGCRAGVSAVWVVDAHPVSANEEVRRGRDAP